MEHRSSDPSSVDDDVIAGFRAGDPDSVRAVYRAFARPVATVAASVVGRDQALIDEVVQQTFTKAWRAADSFDPTRRFSSWLYAIARRAAIDAVRAERRPTRGDHEPEVDGVTDPPSMVAAWESYEIRRVIEDLPDEERDVVKLGHLLGFTQAEIAEQLGVPIGTVKSRSHRAHRRLAAALSHLRAGREDLGAPKIPSDAEGVAR